jgi:hypothetical protein
LKRGGNGSIDDQQPDDEIVIVGHRILTLVLGSRSEPLRSEARKVSISDFIREAFRLEWVTIGWMTVEAATAFGLDSIVELAPGCVLVWRLSVELRRGQAFPESAERTATRRCMRLFPSASSSPVS